MKATEDKAAKKAEKLAAKAEKKAAREAARLAKAEVRKRSKLARSISKSRKAIEKTQKKASKMSVMFANDLAKAASMLDTLVNEIAGAVAKTKAKKPAKLKK